MQQIPVDIRVSVCLPEVFAMCLYVVPKLSISGKFLLAHLTHVLYIVASEHVHVL